MRHVLHLLAPLLLTLSFLPFGRASAQPLDEVFRDGFESGDVSAWGQPESFSSRYRKVQWDALTMTPAQFAERYAAPPAVTSLSYDPLSADFIAHVRQEIGLSGEQEALLAANGFVVLNHSPYLTFEETYSQIYERDLPVLVTTDSVLHALHRSYDGILEDLETLVLVAEVSSMLGKMHAELAGRVAAGELDAERPAVRDVDVYLIVARSLLAGAEAAPATGEAALAAARVILEHAAALQPATLDLFDQAFAYDYSQFKPRGHYEDQLVLQRYFRALMWLGRTELRLSHNGRLGRTALEGAYLMNDLLDAASARPHWDRVNRVVEVMVGEKDGMDPRDLDRFRADTGLLTLDDLAAAADGELEAALAAGSYGIQRIQSQILFNGPDGDPIVLPRVYLLMGQRFVIDSYVLHNLVYDRVRADSPRMLPDPLDVAFAALGADAAAGLLAEEIGRYRYQGSLHEVRFLVDSHPDDFWDANLYNGWLKALRALSDSGGRESRPEAMRTRAWDHKLLGTQLASWAELRHDTLLYAKQSYSGGITCEYPDAYVEPYPLLYRGLAHLAGLGLGMTAELTASGLTGVDLGELEDFFRNMAEIMATLEEIARKELAREPLSDGEWHFLRQTIEKEETACGPDLWDGWYPSLFYDTTELGTAEPTIADVHTAPTDGDGNPVGWVLHAATGHARMVVFTLAGDGGVHAYVGPVSSFHTVLEEGFTRHTNSEWARMLSTASESTRPPWDSSFAR